jgi:UDP:flavonoid glycosyltransferase YjiC (YdhE family)
LVLVRVLCSSSSGAGHFGPMVPFVRALQSRGDDVLVAVPPARQEQAGALEAELLPLPDPPEEDVAEVWSRVRAGRPASVDQEIFAGLNTTAYLPVLERACREWTPDLVLHEAAEFAGAIAANHHGIRHAQIAIGLAAVEAGALQRVSPVLEKHAAGVSEAIRASPYFTRLPASLDPSPYPDTRRVRVDPRQEHGEAADPESLIFVSFGTVVGALPIAAEIYRETLAALNDLPLRAVLTTGGTGAGLSLGAIPDNVTVVDWVDQAAMIARATVVVCHGGAGTTFGALESGVPVVVVPFMADQPSNARIVTAAGAGLTVPPSADDATGSGPLRERLRKAIDTVLREPSFRRNARVFADETAAMPAINSIEM